MHYHVEAKYFDGQSSVPHQITIDAIDQLDELRLRYANGASFLWDVEDLYFEQYGNCLEVRNKLYSAALLQINNEAFSTMFLKAMKRKNKVDVHHRLLNLGFPKIVAIAVALLALIVVAYFYVLPPIAEKSAALIPESFDTYIGDTFMDTFFHENNIDSAKTKLLEEFAANIDFENTKPLHITVVESGEINAFAVPNGQIVVYSSILNKIQNADELAALLAHEAVHINNRHSIKMLCRNLAGYLLVSLVFSDVNGIMAVLADNAQQIHSLTYSRKFEQEADEQGLKIMMNNHIDPNGIVELFTMLESEGGIVVPKIISTHPLTKERKETMQEIITNTEHRLLPHKTLDSLFVLMKQ